MGKSKGISKEKAVELIEDMLNETASIKSILKKHGVRASDFYLTVFDDAELTQTYARYQAARTEQLMLELPGIAKNTKDPHRARVMTDVHKFLIVKMNPKKYGDKLDLNVNQVVDIGAALKEAHARTLPPSSPPQLEQKEVFDLTNALRGKTTESESVAVENDPSNNSSDDIFD